MAFDKTAWQREYRKRKREEKEDNEENENLQNEDNEDKKNTQNGLHFHTVIFANTVSLLTRCLQ